MQFTYLISIKDVQARGELPALQNMKFFNFFLFFWVIFAVLDPDPDLDSGSGSTDLIEIGPNPDLDQKHSLSGSLSGPE